MLTNDDALPYRSLGRGGPAVGAIGLGCMGMSWAYAESTRDDAESIRTVLTAIDAGVTLIDTADVYGDGHNEELLGRALRHRRDEVVLATKGGLVVDDAATQQLHRDGSPAHLATAARASLQRLGTDVIDLYYLHRLDETVPLAESWSALADLVREGLVRRIGLSEVTVAQAAEAQAIHPVSAVQSELSLWTRDPLGSGPDDDLVAWCAREGAAFVPFSPLGRGFLTGALDSSTVFEDSDFRSRLPRFTTQARERNQEIVDRIARVAVRHGCTPAQVALAWVLAQGEHVIPIPGTRRTTHLAANCAAARIVLSADDLAELSDVPSAFGARY